MPPRGVGAGLRSVRPGSPAGGAQRRRLAYAVLAGLGLLGACFYLWGAPAFGAGDAAQRQPRAEARDGLHRKSGKDQAAFDATSEALWWEQLGPEGCKATEALRVCAHRASSAELEEDVYSGSLAAYTALWRAGIRCYDIDGLVTADGQVLAVHPEDLREVAADLKLGEPAAAAASHSLAALRKAGLSEERFPTVEAVIAAFGAQLEVGGQLWGRDEPPDYARLPLLLLTVKGGASAPDVLRRLAAATAAAKATPHVALFVSAPPQHAAVRAAGFSGPLVLGFRDQDDPNPPLTAELVAPYAMLGPSVKMSDAFFAAAAPLAKPTHAWTVDTPELLHRALRKGVDSVISNKPLALNKILSDWRDRCSDKQA